MNHLSSKREFSKLLIEVSREGNVFVIGFADPDHVEVHLSGFDNIPLVEQLKIGAGFRCCTGNERTPRLLAFTVHRIAVYLPHSADSNR